MMCRLCGSESKVKYSVLYNINICDTCLRFERSHNLDDFSDKEWKEEFARRGISEGV